VNGALCPLRIGDHGPMGHILIAGETGNDFVVPLYPRPGKLVVEKPGRAPSLPPGSRVLGDRKVTHLAIAG
jgi:hypothetical protein